MDDLHLLWFGTHLHASARACSGNYSIRSRFVACTGTWLNVLDYHPCGLPWTDIRLEPRSARGPSSTASGHATRTAPTDYGRAADCPGLGGTRAGTGRAWHGARDGRALVSIGTRSGARSVHTAYSSSSEIERGVSD